MSVRGGILEHLSRQVLNVQVALEFFVGSKTSTAIESECLADLVETILGGEAFDTISLILFNVVASTVVVQH
jgi:hypothetical protein